MRPIANFTLHAALAAALAALAAASAAAASDYYLKFDTVKGESAAKASGGKQLEIESWSWGATNARDWNGTIKGPPAAGKYGAVGGMHRDAGLAAPLDRGSVRVKVKFPWLGCSVGEHYPYVTLELATARYELKDAIISSCAQDAVALDYAKVKVRAWDPAKKEH